MRKYFVPVAILAALLSAQSANAGFAFTDIAESSPTGDAPPLTFGLPPTIITFPNSSLTIAKFDPTGFASQINGVGTDITDGRLQFTIMGNDDGNAPGDVDNIHTIDFREAGGYEILNGGSEVTYSLTVLPTILFADGAAAFVPLPGVTIGGSENSGTGNWLLELSYNVVAAATGLVTDPYSITKIEFELDNRLTARGTTDSSGAFIDKKDFSITVPEPSSFLFLGMVLGGAAVWQKRRKVTALAGQE